MGYGKFCYYEKKNQSVRSFKAQYWEVTPMVRSHTNKDPYTKMKMTLFVPAKLTFSIC